MTDYATRLSALSPEKRELFELLMRESDGRGRNADRPPTTVEAALATIWAEVLGVESVGLDDDFFELGGDSIQCIQIVAKGAAAGRAHHDERALRAPHGRGGGGRGDARGVADRRRRTGRRPRPADAHPALVLRARLTEPAPLESVGPARVAYGPRSGPVA